MLAYRTCYLSMQHAMLKQTLVEMEQELCTLQEAVLTQSQERDELEQQLARVQQDASLITTEMKSIQTHVRYW